MSPSAAATDRIGAAAEGRRPRGSTALAGPRPTIEVLTTGPAGISWFR
jgi:hypothetical protein